MKVEYINQYTNFVLANLNGWIPVLTFKPE